MTVLMQENAISMNTAHQCVAVLTGTEIMAGETYYSVLEISETASAAEIRAAYRRLISEVHPDKLANAPAYWQRKAEEKTKEINLAFGVLASSEKRAVYDAQLRACRSWSQTTSSASKPTPPSSSSGGQQSSTQNHSEEGYRSAPHASYDAQRNQSRPDAAKSSAGAQSTPAPKSAPVSVFRKGIPSWIFGLLGFASATSFWNAPTTADAVVFFGLSCALLTGLALIKRQSISKLLSRTRLNTPKRQFAATISTIAILLLAGRVAFSSQSEVPVHLATPASQIASSVPASTSASGVNITPTADTQLFIRVSLPNGTEILKRRRNIGHGKLTVDNGTSDDAVVALLDVTTRKAIRAFYIEAGKQFTEQQIGPGNYNIVYMIGIGWDASTRKFSRLRETGAFDEVAEFSEKKDEETGAIDFHEFSITLQPVAGGSAHTSEVDQGLFTDALAENDLQ
jgi:hypothetical protein